MSDRSVRYDGNIFHDANKCLSWLEVTDTSREGHVRDPHWYHNAPRPPTVLSAQFLVHLPSDPLPHTPQLPITPTVGTNQAMLTNANEIRHLSAPPQSPKCAFLVPSPF